MKLKEAVMLASKHLPEVFPEAEDQELRLEGVEKTVDGLFWKVTFSYPDASPHRAVSRDYKTVKLRDTNGELLGAQNGMLLDVL